METLTEALASQRGLFTRGQARASGLSDRQIRHRLASGAWRPVLPTVYALAGRQLDLATRDLAAQLAVPRSVLSVASAARLHGIEVPDRRSFLGVDPRYHHRLPGVVLLREIIPGADRILIDGRLATNRRRTVFDCARALPDLAALALLETALLREHTTMTDLTTRVHLHVGRHGAPRLARLVRQLSDGSRSTAERLAIQLLRQAGITGWLANHPIEGIGVADLAFPVERVIIEVDGWAHHISPDRFQRDRTRQNALVTAGWTVLRFTWRDLTRRPESTVATIRRALATPGPGPGP